MPEIISVQGRLTDVSDNPVIGNTQFMFKIYDSSVGGNLVWQESQTISITDPQGTFTALLGSVTALTFAFNKAYWLQVEISGQVLSPRYMLTSAPYALNARSAGDVYCKRTTNLYFGDFYSPAWENISNADRLCSLEFPGWSFANTIKELKMILKYPVSAYTGINICIGCVGSTEYVGSIDGRTTNTGWLSLYPEISDEYDCTLSNVGSMLRPTETGWSYTRNTCYNKFPLWCCPPSPTL